MSIVRRIYNRIERKLNPPPKRFDSTGERVDITYTDQINFEGLDMYQKSHFRRYEFANNIIKAKEKCGDFACGTGYGSVMLSKKAQRVVGADLNAEVIAAVSKRYEHVTNVEFLHANLLDLTYQAEFDTIVSFETIEHFSEENIPMLLAIYSKALKPEGQLIFSTPYMQARSEAALKMGHHLTFCINEEKLEQWLKGAGFQVKLYKYQNYDTHTIQSVLDKKDFIVCVAQKL